MTNPARRLAFDLTPIFMSQLGLRKLISTGRWSRIRRNILLERGPVCAACGFKAEATRLMNAHEVFEYDTRKEIIRLTAIELLCPWCHQCHHFDHYQRLVSVGSGGKTLSEDRLIKHYCDVNQCSREIFDADFAAACQRKAQLEEIFGCNIRANQVTYGPYQHELEAHRQASRRWHGDDDADEDENYEELLHEDDWIYAHDEMLR
jgi:hypothetical protein